MGNTITNNSFCTGFKNGFTAGVKQINKTRIGLLSRFGTLDTTKNKTSTVASKSLENLNSPNAGGAGGVIAYSAGGFVGGLFGGAFGAGICTVEFWGTGTGLWVEGEKHDNEGMVTAGRILVLYVTLPIIGIGAVTGGIAGAAAAGIAAAED